MFHPIRLIFVRKNIVISNRPVHKQYILKKSYRMLTGILCYHTIRSLLIQCPETQIKEEKEPSMKVGMIEEGISNMKAETENGPDMYCLVF